MEETHETEEQTPTALRRGLQGEEASVEGTRVRCVGCGYDLSGAHLGGGCPECGVPVMHSLNTSGDSLPPSGKAIAAMVLGICSIPACFFYGVPGLICGILAIVFWHLARGEILRGERSAASLGMATAGLVCGSIGAGLALLGIVVMAALIGVSIYSGP